MKKKAVKIICVMMGLVMLGGCGSAPAEPSEPPKSAESEEAVSEEPEETAEPEEEVPEKAEKKEKGEIPKLVNHRYSSYEWGEGSIPLIKHSISFVTVDKERSGSYEKLETSLLDALNEVLSMEQENWDDEHDVIDEVDDPKPNFEESWMTYVRRADSSIVSIVNEYCAGGQFDSDFYNDYIAHTYHTESGKEMELSEIVLDEEKFFDAAASKLADYVEYARNNIYADDIETDAAKLKSDLMESLSEGGCAWTADPQGVTIWIDGYTVLPMAASVTVLFSEDESGEIFNTEYVPDPDDDWITQIPHYAESTYDIDDSGKEVYVSANEIIDMKETEGSESYYISGLHISFDGYSEKFDTTMPGGTSYYDVFLMHRNHKTIVLENHDEYDTFYMSTFTLDGDGINMADSVNAGLAYYDDDTFRYQDTYTPYCLPASMSEIPIMTGADTDSEQRDIAGVDENGRITAETIDVHGDIDGE